MINMAMKVYVISLLFIISRTVQCYYISPNLFTFEQGIQFCSTHCKSVIASVHNPADHNRATKTIQDSPLIFNSLNIYSTTFDYQNVYIGLKKSNIFNNFTWIDNSSFDYDAWNINQPNIENGDLCVQILVNNNMLWAATNCTHKKRVLCNHCNGILNKYMIGVVDHTSFNNAKMECDSANTTLASMHNDRDYVELKTLCKTKYIDDNQNCWIGLINADKDGNWSNNVIYLDNTTFDFANNVSGGVYPWGSKWGLQPEHGFDGRMEYTVYIYSKDDYKLHDSTDNKGGEDIYSLCNRPSLLCEIDDRSDGIDISDCQLKNDYSAVAWAAINTMQYYNENGLLLINMNLRMNFNPSTVNQYAHTKLTLSGCIGKHYFFGIGNDMNGTILLFVGWWNGSKDEIFNITDLPFKINNDIYYTLSVIVIDVLDGLSFNISLNDIQYISQYVQRINDDESDVNKNGYSGYLGVYAQYTQIHVKSLYVSGTPIKTGSIHKCGDLITVEPTTMTTKYPTRMPTKAPFQEIKHSLLTYGANITIIIKESMSTDNIEQIVAILKNYTLKGSNIEKSKCPQSNGFNANIDKDGNITIIESVVILCDLNAQNRLIAVYKNSNMEKDIVKIGGNSTMISIKGLNNGTYIDENIDNINSNDDNIWIIIIITMGVVIIYCILIICIIIIYKIKRDKNVEINKENEVNIYQRGVITKGLVMVQQNKISKIVDSDQQIDVVDKPKYDKTSGNINKDEFIIENDKVTRN